MPELCRVGSVKIFMWTNDHGPAHVHVVDGRRKDKLYLERLQFEYGRLQPRQQREVLRWARVRHGELERAWRQASANQNPDPVAPLD